MVQSSGRKFTLNPKIAVGIVVVLLFVLGIVQVAQGLIDTHNYRDLFTKLIKEKTGREVTIKGNITVSLLPTPTVYIPGVELHDAGGNTLIPSISVDMIRLDVPLTAVFSDHPRVNSIKLMQPVLEVERSQDNVIHWDWLNAGLLKMLAGTNNAESPAIDIAGGTIIYHDNHTEKTVTADNLRASIRSGNHLGAKGAFTLYGHNLEFSFTVNGLPGADGTLPFTGELNADSHSTLHWQGNVDLLAENPKIKGKFDLTAENVMEWGATPAAAQPVENTHSAEQLANQLIKKQEDEKKVPLPLKLSGDWSQEGLAITLDNVNMEGLNSTGSGKLALGWKDWQPVITCEMKFLVLDYTSWQGLFTEALENKSNADYAEGGEPPENILPKGIQANLNIAAEQIAIGGQTLKNTKMSASLADAVVTVNSFSVELPGESSLTLFGVISQATKGLRLEGSMETSGKSLRQALTMLDASAANLPEIGFGAFYARSNIFVSAEQVRLSEADVKLDELALNGGLVAYFDAKPRLEADIKLKDINFDYLRDAWREKQKRDAAETGKNPAVNAEKGINFNLLNKLRTSIDFKVAVAGFTFMERKGDGASFRIFAKEGEFGLYNVRLNYPEETMEGSLNLNVKGQQPLINVVLNADAIDTGYFINIPTELPKNDAPAVGNGRKVWSKALINTKWLEGYSGTFDININKLTYGKTLINRVKLQAKLDDRLLTFQNFTFDYWQGRCSILGSMYGGEVPGVSVSFMLYDVELYDMLKEIAGRDNITGKASISGSLTTSGVNMLSWVSQSDVKMMMAGRGVNVTGFNLQGVIYVVGISRTAADVFNNVNLALVNGATEFTVDGTANIKNGVMRTPGITLKSGAIVGDLTGEVQLVPWTMSLSTLFQFPMIASERVPTMTVHLAGPIDAAALKTDTSSLEAYVVGRITGK